MIVTSESPTTARASTTAIVVTITLGWPKRSTLAARVKTSAALDPPAPIRPS